MTTTLLTTTILLAAVSSSAEGLSAIGPGRSALAREALARCLQVEHLPPADRPAELDHVFALADQAVSADDGDATAHFAVFCALGKHLRLIGVSFGSLRGLRRLRREIDRTLELAPDWVAALIGKGALLLETPRLFGGDPAQGEKLLSRAVALAPENVDAQLYLARALAAEGARDAARERARTALAAAEGRPEPALSTAARTLLAQLGE
jgi:tetratricopeptide (TPR) repeat protein